MSLNFNSAVDVNYPNQPSPGADYTAAADSAPTIHRKGNTTLLQLTGNLTASRVAQFGTIANEGWLNGDVVFVSIPTHTGGGFTMSVHSIAGTVLTTWAALLAAGGMFVFDGTDFVAALPGASTT